MLTTAYSHPLRTTRAALLSAISAIALTAAPASAAFDTVVNIPGDFPSIAGGINTPNTQLNLADGGTITAGFKLGSQFQTLENIEMNMSGGTVRNGFEAYPGTTVNVSGGSFQGEAGTVGGAVNFTGGSAEDFAVIAGELTVRNGSFNNVAAVTGLNTPVSRIDFRGGSVSTLFGASGNVHTTISGGTFGTTGNTQSGVVFGNGSGSEVSGGSFHGLFGVAVGDTIAQYAALTVSGGSFDAAVVVAGNAEMSISGGDFSGLAIGVTPGAALEVSGGTLDSVPLIVQNRGTLSLKGTAFTIDGAPVFGLQQGTPFLVTQRDVTIGATLADGSTFSYHLDTSPVGNNEDPRDVFEEDAYLFFTLVQPVTLPTPGDTDGDGDIDDADLGTTIANFTGPVGAAGGKTVADGDNNGDGDVDDADLSTLISGFTGPLGPVSVPEPSAAVLLGLGGLLIGRGPRRRRDEAER